MPADLADQLRRANPRYVEDARSLLYSLSDKAAILAATTAWFCSNQVAAWHGSRLTEAEIEAIKQGGLRPLRAEDRRSRIVEALSGHPRWEDVREQLDDQLDRLGRGIGVGRREGQVHLTISRHELTRGFNHYLVEGSEFDGHVANILLGAEGRAEMAMRGRPVLFGFAIPGERAFEACNPFGWHEDDGPNPIRQILAAWSYRLAHPGWRSAEYGLDAGVVFHAHLEPELLVIVDFPDEAELRRHYRS